MQIIRNLIGLVQNGKIVGIGSAENPGAIKSSLMAFTPSIYVGGKTATTTVAGQSELFATGATELEASHINTTSDLIIGFGETPAEAEAACSSGVAGVNKFLLLRTAVAGVPVTMHQPVGTYKAYAWLGVGGTVDWLSTQGV